MIKTGKYEQIYQTMKINIDIIIIIWYYLFMGTGKDKCLMLKRFNKEVQTWNLKLL